MKIKVINTNFASTLEKEVNDFIKKVEVVDIQYSMCMRGEWALYSAMIAYREVE